MCKFWIMMLFFFFKQKTAYEMRISDWSSDVCSSDLDMSKTLAKSFKKTGIEIMTGSEVTQVDPSGKTCKVTVKSKSGTQDLEAEIVLSAVGVSANLEKDRKSVV